MKSYLTITFLIVNTAFSQEEWPTHGGDPGGMKYSTLDSINRETITKLNQVWEWHTGDEPIPASRVAFAGQDVKPGKFQGTPVMLDDTLFIATSYSQVVALSPSTGKELWRFDPRAYDWGMLARGCGFCHRGVAVWRDGNELRVFINTRWRLIALDGRTGEPITSFGHQGEVDLTANLIWEVNKMHYTNTSPPMIYDDIVIVGSGVPDNRIYRKNPPGDIQAFNVKTGERVWSFHTVPQRGEFGSETWENNSWSYTGSNNVWAPFTIDKERGLVYFPVSTPNNDFYGGHRKGDNLFAESILCLDARTGKRVWHFQTVHHGVWDYDLPAPPNLVTITVEGKTIDAVAVVAKTGYTYVFDRVTGKPVWPIEEIPVPQSNVPGEQLSKTQPIPTKPPPFGRQGFHKEDLIDFTPEIKAKALNAVKHLKMGDLYTPPSIEGTLLMPGVWGAANWGGAGFDPETGILYVKATNWPFVFKVQKTKDRTADADYTKAGFAPVTIEGSIPIHKPPYATLTAINLNKGVHEWQIPLGDMPSLKQHPLLQNVELPQLGIGPPQHGQSGPLVTAGGLVFISASSPFLYAFDKETGELVWKTALGGGGFGNPITYRTPAGKQLLVIATSQSDGSQPKLIAYGLTS